MSSEHQAALRERFRAVETSNVADVLDTLGLTDQGLAASFRPFPAGAAKLAGWAFTINGEMATDESAGGDPVKLEACSQLEPGAVAVWAGAGEGVCFFGELIALGMQERGCAGALVDGGVRDVDWLGVHGFPVFARYRTPIQSIGRWRVTGHGGAVELPGATIPAVTIEPRDFILGDADGVIVVPVAVVEDVLERAEGLQSREREIRADIAAGLSLTDALAKYGHV